MKHQIDPLMFEVARRSKELFGKMKARRRGGD